MEFTNFEKYKQIQIESQSFEEETEKWSKGQLFSIETFLLPLMDKNQFLLDVGCGDGTGLKFIQDQGFNNIYGVDFNENKLARAKEKTNNILYSSATELPFNDNMFDIIWCSHVLEHIYNPFTALKEFSRVCKNGGYILIIIPYPSVDFEVHCGVNELKLDILDNAHSCINNIREKGYNVEQYYIMNVREPELYIKIKIDEKI